MQFTRVFTNSNELNTIKWGKREAQITDGNGKIIFELKDVEAPANWSDNAVNIVASKYFKAGETSVKQIVKRVVDWVCEHGIKQKYFTQENVSVFHDELTSILINQYASPNSPVWFNFNVNGRSQTGSACFLLDVNDNMDSIRRWYSLESNIFQAGAGAGINVSKLRPANSPLSQGGTASGPVSFMKGADAQAGTIKSGGRTRRAAKLILMDVNHPDIEEFISCKVTEEDKAQVLINAGYSGGVNGEAINTVAHQNANYSIRVDDRFMNNVVVGDGWANSIMNKIVQASWRCGDPGLLYSDTVLFMYTIPESGPPLTGNPCLEIVNQPPLTACNLASINVLKFWNGQIFDWKLYRHVISIMTVVLDIICLCSDYPDEQIAANTKAQHHIGLGYTNIGSLLMCVGLAYDSDEARKLVSRLSATLTGQAFLVSSFLAEELGAFEDYAKNSESFIKVIDKYCDRVSQLGDPDISSLWNEVWARVNKYGARNANVTAIAPTGTISFMMDASTTGIEPELALVKYKTLVGGGQLKLVNDVVGRSLKYLNYDDQTIAEIEDCITNCNDVINSPLYEYHKSIFATSFGDNSLKPAAHIKMVAAAQNYITEGISKCVAGDTIILVNEGLTRVSDFYNNEKPDSFRDLEYCSIASTQGLTHCKSFYYGGVKQIYKLTLSDGRILRTSDQDQVLVASKFSKELYWKKIVDLTCDDWVALKIGLNIWGNSTSLPKFILSKPHGSQNSFTQPTVITTDMGLFLGMLTADGHITRSTYTVGFTKNDAEVRAKFIQLLETLFGLHGREIEDPRNGVMGVTVGSKSLVEWLDHIEFSKTNIPGIILKSPKNIILSYLSGLYLDGWITKDGSQLAITQKNFSLLRETQAIWDNLGISSYFNDHIVDNTCYKVLCIQGGYRLKAASHLNFLELHKRERACLLFDGQDQRDYFIPNYYELRNKVYNHYGNVDNVWKSLAELKLKERGLYEDYVSLFNYRYLNVLAVETDVVDDVYDFEVPVQHNFIANGIVNHNTINLPSTATVEDIKQIYIDAWRLGLKAVSVYRDGSKNYQPLSTHKIKESLEPPSETKRKRPTRERNSVTRKISIAGFEAYITCGLYPDGTPCELFITSNKGGSQIDGILDMAAMAISLALQHGTPLNAIIEKYENCRYDPSGFTGDPEIPQVTSIADYIAKWLKLKFGDKQRLLFNNGNGIDKHSEHLVYSPEPLMKAKIDGQLCNVCGSFLVTSGTCHTCSVCGTVSGGC
jgi:ribonucleoside-diphosphate reductase alpha chain